MTTEEIKKIVDDEQAEQLTAQLCRHWEVATQRIECLAQELNDNMDTCIEAEIYAALMLPHYDAMWKALIENETIFKHLKVTRKSPHNKQFTARFFCHLVGEMKKSAVFGSHSDHDLAEKLTRPRSVNTYRKNIQEGMDGEDIKTQKAFYHIYQKYNDLARPKK